MADNECRGNSCVFNNFPGKETPKMEDSLIKKKDSAGLGFFQYTQNGEIVVKKADSVWVLVVHYTFERKENLPEHLAKHYEGIARNGDAEDVQNLRHSFQVKRNCNFRDLLSPEKDFLLRLLSDRQQLLKYFDCKDDPTVFLLFFLSHGTEEGVISTDHWSEEINNFVCFNTEDIFQSLKKLENFDKCLKLVNFGSCRGLLADVRFTKSNHFDEKYENRNSCRITFQPKMHNLVVFYSTVETTMANRNEKSGSWFVRAFCNVLDSIDEDCPLLKLLTMVQWKVHIESQGIHLSAKRKGLAGQTPEAKLFSQDALFFFSKAETPEIPCSQHDAIGNTEETPKNPEFYSWESDAGRNIRGRHAFLVYNHLSEETQEIKKTLMHSLNFETSEWQLGRDAFKLLFDKASELEHDIGCVLTCIFGRVKENERKEICVLVQNEEKPITDILHYFIGPKNEKWIGKPKILFLIDISDEEELLHDDFSAAENEFEFKVSATNHSGWFVLILRDKGDFKKLVDILKGDELKRGKCLQDLLPPLLISKPGTEVNVFLNSTLQYLLDFPDWPRSFVKPNFTLASSEEQPKINLDFDKLMEEINNSVKESKFWLLSALAGAGKTTVLKEIAFQLAKCYPHTKILRVSLEKHTKFFSDKYEVDEIEFLANTTQNRPKEIENWIEQKKVIVVLDSFDEICTNHQMEVLELIRALNARGTTLLIGTRPHEVEMIKGSAQTALLLDIQPLNKAKQLNFLQCVAGKEKDESERLLSVFKNQDVLGNPLHLSLLAQTDGDGNLYQIYDKVMQLKVQSYLVNDGYDKTHPKFVCRVENCLKTLRLIAFRVVKGLDPVGPGVKRKDVDEMNCIGVANVVNEKVTFLHQTFAEFLATQHLLKANGPLDSELFLKSNMRQCTMFLDMFYSTVDSEEDIKSHTKRLLSSAQSLSTQSLIALILEGNLKQVFQMVKTSISFSEEQSASVDVLIKSVEREEIAIELLELGIFDKASVEIMLPELMQQIENNNACKFFDRLLVTFSHLPELISKIRLGLNAVRRGHFEILDLLLQKGILSFADFDEMKILLRLACKFGSVKCLEVLLKHGGKKEICEDPLHWAVEFGQMEIVKFLLEEKVSGLNRDDETFVIDGMLDEDWNAFHHSINHGRIEPAEYLISKSKTLIEIKTKDGKSPLQLAAGKRKWEMLLWLRDKNANLNTLIPSAVRKFWTERDRTEYEHFLMLQSDVTKKDEEGKSPLHCAAKHGYYHLVRELIAAGAEVAARDENGWNAMHFACHSPRGIKTIKLLHSENPSLATEKTSEGKTPLHLLLENGDDQGDITRFLVQHAGVDVNVQDCRGSSAVSIVQERFFPDSIKTLILDRYFNPSIRVSLPDQPDQVDAMYKKSNEALENENRLLHACQSKKWDEVRELLSKHFNVNVQSMDGRTALHHVAESGSLTLGQELLSLGADVNSKDRNGTTALLEATHRNCQELLQTLLDHGTETNLENEHRVTALHVAAYNGYSESVQKLLNSGAKVDLQCEYGWTALHLAASRNNADLVQILIAHGADVTIKDRKGLTAMDYAVRGNCLESVKRLIELDPDRFWTKILKRTSVQVFEGENCPAMSGDEDDVDSSSRIPLPVTAGCRKLLEKLLELGADVNLKTTEGFKALFFAVKENDLELMLKLLEHGADVNQQEKDGSTALHLAVSKNQHECVQLLLDYGADVNLKNNKGMIPLDLTKEMNCPDITEMLLSHSQEETNLKQSGWSSLLQEAIKSLDIQAETSSLHLAVLENNPELLQTLLDQGFDANSKTSQGWTALHVAVWSNNLQMVRKLIENGAQLFLDDEREINILQHALENLEMIRFLHGEDKDVTSLHLAVKNSEHPLNTIVALVEEFNDVNQNGESAILRACRRGKWNIVDILLTKKLNVSIKDRDGKTALHYAARSGKLDLVKELVERGADLTVKDDKGLNVLQHALKHFETVFFLHELNGELIKEELKDGSTSLHVAITRGSLQVIRFLVDEIKIDLDKSNDSGLTGLVLACRRKMWVVVELLLDNNVDVSKADRAGKTALQYAMESQRLDLLHKIAPFEAFK
ncbi:uncharacterized protein LOC135942228 [Cloeon dipterum]|uniref:uncharacterized protein LOC135942228 n=1 Tax=Cloeon dipterum TaxID=197152 RepID=UPI00321FC505